MTDRSGHHQGLEAIVVGRPIGFLPDPSGRHEFRYFDGSSWTETVADHGTVATERQAGAFALAPFEIEERRPMG